VSGTSTNTKLALSPFLFEGPPLPHLPQILRTPPFRLSPLFRGQPRHSIVRFSVALRALKIPPKHSEIFSDSSLAFSQPPSCCLFCFWFAHYPPSFDQPLPSLVPPILGVVPVPHEGSASLVPLTFLNQEFRSRDLPTPDCTFRYFCFLGLGLCAGVCPA